MRDLKIGDRVRTPRGEEIVIAPPRWGLTVTASRKDVDHLYARNEMDVCEWEPEYVTPLPPDIPRAAVEDLLAAVDKRVAALSADMQRAAADNLTTTWAEKRGGRAELDFVAAALRNILGGAA